MSNSRGSERHLKRASTASSPAEEVSSRRASTASPVEPVKAQIDFQFLNFSHPSEAKTGKTRKAVRSHVTRQQHQRENAAAAARRARNHSMREADERPLRPAESSEDRFARMTDAEPSQSEASSPSLSPSASPTYPPRQQLDPTDIYPEEWHPYIARIMEHYFSNLAVDNPDLDGPEATGLLRTRFFPFILTDPAPMHAVMLVAASHYGRSRDSRTHTIDLLQLRGMAIREINLALEEPARALSDQIIAAVAKMASYELLFGERTIFFTHMTGLLRLVSMRGGLPALGLDGLLERILLWIDANASHITGSHVFFDKSAFPTSAIHPRPDPVRFCGGLN